MMDGGGELWSTEGADGSANEGGRWRVWRAEMNDGEGRRRWPTEGPTAMTDGGDRRVMVKAKLTGVTNMELEETYGRLEATGGCDRRSLGLLAGGGWRMWPAGSMNQQREGGAIFSWRKPADVASGR